jgi:hypothetical protein
MDPEPVPDLSVCNLDYGSETVPDLAGVSLRELLTSEVRSSSVSPPLSSSMAADSSMFCCPAWRLLAAVSENRNKLVSLQF